MSRPADPSSRVETMACTGPGAIVLSREHRRRRPWAAALIALPLAGCGGTSAAVSHALNGASASGTATRFSQQLMRSWCPQAVAAGGRRLTEAQARGCLRQARDAWLHELRRNGYDPNRVGR